MLNSALSHMFSGLLARSDEFCIFGPTEPIFKKKLLNRLKFYQEDNEKQFIGVCFFSW